MNHPCYSTDSHRRQNKWDRPPPPVGARALWRPWERHGRQISQGSSQARQDTLILTSFLKGASAYSRQNPRAMGTRVEDIQQRRSPSQNRPHTAFHLHKGIIWLVAKEPSLPAHVTADSSLLVINICQGSPLPRGQVRVRRTGNVMEKSWLRVQQRVESTGRMQRR